MGHFSVSSQTPQSLQAKPPFPVLSPATAAPRHERVEQALIAQDNTRVSLPQQGLNASQFCLAESPESELSEKTTPGDILKKHGAAVALEQGVHKGAHQIMHRTASKVAAAAGGKVAQQAIGHAAGEALAHGAGQAVGAGAKILSRAVPAVGTGVAGYLAYKSADHAIEAGKKGNLGAAASYGAAALVDGAIAGVNAVGTATGVGVVISVPVSLGLAVVATGLASLGAWLDDDPH